MGVKINNDFNLFGRNRPNQKVVFGVLEDHVDGFILEDDLLHGNNVLMADLPVQLDSWSGSRCVTKGGRTHCNLSDGTLTDSGVCDDLTLLVGFELFNGVYVFRAVFADGFVHASVCPRRYETDDLVP